MTDLPLVPDAETAVRPSDAPVTPANAERFTPGMVIADRYRIIAPLGRGGMGEVYRADDLRLGQPVALKFLPHEAAIDEKKLERLFAEVRIGRQVSHPNVCRLYDLVEWNGTHFIAMEFVDGEDLSSLLRRIGRVPHDKALDIARDLAGGLAAAHDLGVIHRDLKPANVMIDGRGRARITDFGLAVLAEEGNARGWAGTPAYMAPEQLRGGEVTAKTDLYALGLILYEVFTGKRAFEGTTLQEILAKHASTSTPSITSTLREVDPAVERVVARCLDHDPAARPSSAHAVIAALPGGDPLAAAVAAGETPSPEMIAAAGKVGDLRVAAAWGALLLALFGIVASVILVGRTNAMVMLPSPKSSDVLEDRAREIDESLGYAEKPVDTAREWLANVRFLNYMIKKHRAAKALEMMPHVRPGLFVMGTVFSSRRLIPLDEDSRVQMNDPEPAPGMQRVIVDSFGRLVEFLAVPPDLQTAVTAPPKYDWNVAFAAAGLDPSRFHAVTPTWNAPVDSDDRLAWEGTIAGQEDIPVHVEARSRLGRPVWYSVFGPWDQPRELRDKPLGLGVIPATFNFMIAFGLLPIAGVLAIRNLRRGRGDRKGATRLALTCFVLLFFAFLFRADHRPISGEDWILSRFAGIALFNAARVWLYYVALEPFIRRRWPHTLISWTRLVSGRFTDPLVGRDVLVGVIGGTAISSIMMVAAIAGPWFGLDPVAPASSVTSPLGSARHVVYFLLSDAAYMLWNGVALLVMVALLHAILRNRTVAIGASFALCTVLFWNTTFDPRLLVPAVLVCAAIVLTVILRAGLVSTAVTGYCVAIIRSMPLTFDTSSWFFGRSLLAIAVLAGFAIFGFVVALGGKPLFGTPLLEE